MKLNLEDIELATLDQEQEEQLREVEQQFNTLAQPENEEIYLIAFKRKT